MNGILETMRRLFGSSYRGSTHRIHYHSTTVRDAEGKIVKETTVLEDGGACQTPEEVKAVQDRMQRVTKKMEDLGKEVFSLLEE